jgi:lipopolysaccharide transport system permease protein
MQLALYATPVIYPVSSVPVRWLWLYRLNPLVGILEGFRNVLARGQSPDLPLLLWALPGIVLSLLVSWPLFRVLSQYFADVL